MSTGFNDCEVECARLRVALAAARRDGQGRGDGGLQLQAPGATGNG